MANISNAFDSVFKTMKVNHIRMFIPVINEIYGTDYTKDDPVNILTSEGYFLSEKEFEKRVEHKESDFLIVIHDHYYLIESQSYEDGSMDIRIAEYAFMSARSTVKKENGYAVFTMPEFTVIYVRSGDNTPKETKILFRFPDGTEVPYKCRNVMINDYSKEEIFENKLYPYLPFYLTRYEKIIKNEKSDIEVIEREIQSISTRLDKAMRNGDLDDSEYKNLRDFIEIIIRHIANGNKNEERLVNSMGGTVFETASQRLIREGKEIGDEIRLIKTICKMLKRGDTIDEISDFTEEDEIRISLIAQVALKVNPPYDVDAIYEELHK